jgi:hypothetical protein
MQIIIVIKFGDAAEHFLSTCPTHAKGTIDEETF